MEQESNEKKFYEKKWFAVVMTIFFAPVGIYLLWRYKHFSIVPRILFAGFFSIIFLIALFSEDEISEETGSKGVEEEQTEEVEKEGTNDEESTEEVEEEVKEEIDEEDEIEEEIEKEKLYMELVSSSYNKDEDKVSLNVNTNFADGIEVDVGFYDTAEEFIVPIFLSSGEISDGELVMDIHHMEDDSLLTFILNGEYNIKASMSTHNDESLLTAYESYDYFIENFELEEGEVEETESGFKIEEILLGSIEITDAYSQAEYDQAAFEEDKDLYDTLDYAQLRKNPNGHAGEFVYYTGEIIQIMEEVDFTVIRLAVTETSYGYDPNDVVWVEYDDNTEFIDGDIVTVYGMIIGSHSYTSQAGWEITVPAMLADWIE